MEEYIFLLRGRKFVRKSDCTFNHLGLKLLAGSTIDFRAQAALEGYKINELNWYNIFQQDGTSLEFLAKAVLLADGQVRLCVDFAKEGIR